MESPVYFPMSHRGYTGLSSEFSSRTAWICRISPDVLSKTFEQMRQPTLALFLRLAGRQNPPGPPASALWSVSGSKRTLLEAHGECDYRKRPPRRVPGAKRAALGDASPPPRPAVSAATRRALPAAWPRPVQGGCRHVAPPPSPVPAEGKGKSGKPDVVEVIYRQFEHGKERQ